MLNKKAIAAFAAGATLLSGMAFAAPAFVSAPAFANQTTVSKRDIAKLKQTVKDEEKAAKAARKNADEKKAAETKAKGEKDGAFSADTVGKVLAKGTLAGTGADAAKYTLTKSGNVVTHVEAIKDQGDAKVAEACNTYIAKVNAYNTAVTAAQAAENDANAADAKLAEDQAKLSGYENASSAATQKLADALADVTESLATVKSTYKAAVDARRNHNAAKAALKKAQKTLKDFEDSATANTRKTAEYRTKHTALKNAIADAQDALDKAAKADTDALNAYNEALSDHTTAYAAYSAAFVAAGEAANSAKDPSAFDYDSDDHDIDADAAKNAGTNNDNGNGGEGEGGSSENGKDKNKGKITPEEAKALAEFAVKYVKDAKSDPKTVKALTAALTKVTAAKKAKDAKALVAALKELKALVDPLMKKAPAKDTGKALESVFGSDVLYTKYKGLAVDLIKLGVTNIGAYDALLNQLEFGLSRYGWENIIKNFPEHNPAIQNNCAFLSWLRRHLTKAVAHYGHVEAAVKDIQAELNEDMKDAQARHDWDAVKVIDQKLGLANGLREVAHHNLTRAKALLNSADDHARDLSCDTAAKEVRAAMDKEPNSPFKKSGQKNNAQKPNGQNGQKPNGGAAGHTLGKTGATVALVAVAASVLAGMGAALRKIRH